MLYSRKMEMKVDRKAAVKKLRNLVLTPKSEVEPFREKIEQTFSSVFVPSRVECVTKDYGGVKCDVLLPEAFSSRRTIIYVHGGSFVAGSRESWRPFCAQLAASSMCRVIVPEFRLPPSHPFPAGIDDLNAVFRMVYAEEEVNIKLSGDREAQVEMVVAGDGSGASLAVALVLKLDERYRKSLRDLVLISPWLDLTNENPLMQNHRLKDEIINGENLHRAVDLYTYSSNVSNMLVSPLKANVEEFRAFPPVFIQMGEKEILVSQAEQFSKLMYAAGTDCTLDLWPNMMFMFQMADEYLSESHFAIEKLGKRLSRREDLDENEKLERSQILKRNNIFETYKNN